MTTSENHLDAEAIAAYLDHGLEASERERAVAHLSDCSDCRERLAAQARAEGRTTAAIAIGPRRRAPAWAPLLAAAAVGALLLSVGLWYAIDDPGPGMAERRDEPAERVAEPPASPAGAQAPVPGVEEPRGAIAQREPAEAPAPEEELLAMRGASKTIEGKTFRLEDGTWTDTAYARALYGAPRDVARDTPAYDQLLAREPRLPAWAEAGPSVLVLVDSVPFRVLPPTD